jgi:hypothetical protein
VFIENGLAAALAGLLGMVPVSIAVTIFGRQAGITLGVGVPAAIAIVAGVTLLAAITATIVAWRPAQARPSSVLRYE